MLPLIGTLVGPNATVRFTQRAKEVVYVKPNNEDFGSFVPIGPGEWEVSAADMLHGGNAESYPVRLYRMDRQQELFILSLDRPLQAAFRQMCKLLSDAHPEVSRTEIERIMRAGLRGSLLPMLVAQAPDNECRERSPVALAFWLQNFLRDERA